MFSGCTICTATCVNGLPLRFAPIACSGAGAIGASPATARRPSATGATPTTASAASGSGWLFLRIESVKQESGSGVPTAEWQPPRAIFLAALFLTTKEHKERRDGKDRNTKAKEARKIRVNRTYAANIHPTGMHEEPVFSCQCSRRCVAVYESLRFSRNLSDRAETSENTKSPSQSAPFMPGVFGFSDFCAAFPEGLVNQHAACKFDWIGPPACFLQTIVSQDA